MGNNAFANFINLLSINLRNCSKLSSIGDNAFYNNKLLSEIIFSNASIITSLGISGVEGCVNLERLENLHLSIKYIEQRTFYNCQLLNVDFNWFNIQLTKINQSAFYGNNKLANLDLSNFTMLEKIDSFAFANCPNLKEVTIPINCFAFGTNVFKNSLNISTINLDWLDINRVSINIPYY
ncbi:MAG: leucine-rich repeat domain-containing protein, partial [Ureaplasma sp.]|nr:leucine-rich repeat domain-containing protein [Ureaplasma sp.]